MTATIATTKADARPTLNTCPRTIPNYIYIYAKVQIKGHKRLNYYELTVCFAASELSRGVRYDSYGARSQSLVMRSRSGTVRVIDTQHRADHIGQYSSADFR